MTGNTNKWRAPLAGLASLAMVATMGVVASTATAADVNPTPSQVAKGESYADQAARVAGSYTEALLAEGGDTTTFGGWAVGGKSVALTGVAAAGENVARVNNNLKNGVRLHFKSQSAGTQLDWGYVIVPASTHGTTATVTVQPGQLPYDFADGWKLDLTKVTVGTQTVDLSKGGSFEVNANQIGTTVDANVKADSAWTLTFTAAPTRQDLDQPTTTDVNVVYPGAAADGTNDANYSVDVAKGATFDPQSVIDAATIRNVPGKFYTIDRFVETPVDFGKAGFTASTPITKNLTLDPVFHSALTVTFWDNGKVYATKYVTSGQAVSKPADPTRNDGSIFAGWYEDVNGSGKLDNGESLFSFDAPVNKNVNLYSWWVNGGSHTVTYKFADGKTADKTETYVASQKTARPADPTRDGYIFAGWYQDVNNDGVLDAGETKSADGFAFGYTLDGNVTLIARWLQADKATLEAAFNYVNGGDASFNKDKYQSVFTDASFKAYVATYQGVQKKYADARNAADAKNEQIPADTYTSLLNELVAAWQKLEFVHEGTLTTDPTTVYRLYNGKSGDHFYTQNVVELKRLQKLDLGYANEGRLFQTAPNATDSELADVYAGLQDFKNASKLGGDTVNEDIVKTLDSIADPILTEVTRLYNRVNGDHVWSVSADEVASLSASADWNNEGPAFYVPRYTGSQSVTRLYNAKLSRHVLSTSASEQANLAKNGWTVEGVAFKAY